MRLVELLDQLIPLLERDPSYSRYLLDGQMAVIDDYLEVRPEMEERLRALCASGRVSVGPWYILVDEFLVSPETIVRDLQLGLERAAAFGGATSVGYLPDMFGHIAQMPQILSLAGFSDTVLWRGVPSAITQTGFDWIAPDGTSIRAEYLVSGYGNGASLPSDAKALVRRTTSYIEEVESFLLGDLLYMNGSDHLLPQAHLGRVVAEANDIQGELHFEITSLAEYISTAPRQGLTQWKGELRSGFRSNILMGVLSNRVDVKRLASLCERTLEHRAEPIAALFGHVDVYPAALLNLAWRDVIRNAAHDSICACSVDDTVDSVLERFRQARQIGEGVAHRALQRFSERLARRGVTVVNSLEFPRSGLVEALVDDSDFDATRMQVLEQRGALPNSMLLDAQAMRSILSVIQGTRLDEGAYIHDAVLARSGDEASLDVTVGPYERPDVDINPQRLELISWLAANPALHTRVTLSQPAIRRVLALSGVVDGFGWAALEPQPPTHSATAEASHLSNGLIDVDVATDGTYSLNGVANYGRLVDDGDFGDSYNYSPPLGDERVTAPVSVSTSVLESGPLRARLAIEATYSWPERVDEATQSRTGRVEVPVTTVLELRADDPTLYVTTTFINQARDHRLRVELPLRHAATTSSAECAFTVVTRGLTAEGRSEEFGLPTFPSRRFVEAGGLTVAHEGLHEYELTNLEGGAATTISLTLLRATGMLSRLGMKLRPLPAGPLTPVEGLQMVGQRISARYALRLEGTNPFQFTNDFLTPLETVSSQGGGELPDAGSTLNIRGATVSAVRRVAGALEVRVFNPTNQTVQIEITGRHGWIVDLRGRGLQPFEGSVSARPHEIITLRVDDAQ